MALSGSEYVLFGPGSHYKLQVDWSATQNTANNQSTITATLKMYSDPSWSMYSSTSTTGTIVIDGTTYNITHSGGISTGGGSWITLGSASKTVTHGSDGTRTFSLSGSYHYNNVNVNGTIIGNTSLSSQNFTLNTIPRQSTLSSPNPPSWTAGNSVTFNLTRYSSSFSSTVKLEAQKSDSTWLTVATLTGCTTSASFTGTNMDTGEITTIFTALGGRASCASRLTITTYSGSGSTGSVIGSAQTYTGTITAPAATKATLSNFNIGDTVSVTVKGANSAFVHNLTWTFGGYSRQIATSVNGVYSWDTSLDASGMYAQIPNAFAGIGGITCTTYYNGVQVQQPVGSATITATVVNSNPTFTGTGITYKDNTSAISAITGNDQYIVQNASDLLVSLPTSANATAKNSATISYYVAQCGGATKQVNYSSSATITFDLGKINLAANDYIYVTAYDSRGFTTQIKLAVNIVPWKPPTVNSTSKRDDGFSDPSTITLTGGTYSPVTISTDKNDIVSVKYKYTVKGTAYPSSGAGSLTDFPSMTHSGGTFSAPNLALTLTSSSAWSTEVQIVDKIMQALGQSPVLIDNTVNVGIPAIFIDVINNSLGVGQFTTNPNSLEVADQVIAGGKVTSTGLTVTGTPKVQKTGGQMINLLQTDWDSTLGSAGSYNYIGFGDKTIWQAYVGYASGSNGVFSINNSKMGDIKLVAKTGNKIDITGDVSISGTINNPAKIGGTLLNGWANYGSGYQPLAYWKDKNGVVHLEGVVCNGTGVIMTLPAGYRPENREMFGTVSNNATGRIDVLNTGDVQMNAGTNTWISLSGISFKAVN